MTSTERGRSFAPMATLVAALLLLAAFPWLPGLPPYWITLMNFIGLGSLVALGLILLSGIGGMTSFGQAAFVGLGAYATAFLTTAHGISPWLTLPVSVALTAASAWLLGAITLRLSGHFLTISTIAWGLALYYLFGNLGFLGRYDGLHGLPPLRVLNWPLSRSADIYYVIWIFVVLALVCAYRLLDSRPGRAMRALNGGASMAESFGVDTRRYRTIVFVLAASLAGLSGWLYAHLTRGVNPTPFGINAGIEYMLMAVLGGSGHLLGAVAGSALVTVGRDQLQSLLPALIGNTGNYETIVFGALLVLTLHWAPEGLWPLIGRLLPTRARPTKFESVEALGPAQRAAPADGPLLTVDKARKTFGGLVAVNDISLQVGRGEIVALIGPNGAGKSTTFNLITGVLRLDSGEITFAGHRIDGLEPREIVAHGVARTFQHVQLLPSMSVVENVALGAHLGGRSGVVRSSLGLNSEEERQLFGAAGRALEQVGLSARKFESAGSLPLGSQRAIEIARALCAQPMLLLLDEPAAGLRHKEKADLARVLEGLARGGMSILLVEHDMDFVMGLAQRIVVMDFGTRIAEGNPEQVQADPVVLEAYLGGVDDE